MFADKKINSKLEDSYLKQLAYKRDKIDETMKQRQAQQQKSLNLFLNHIKRQLEMLVTDKSKLDERNNDFKNEIKKHSQNFRKGLSEILESSENLNESKKKYMQFLQKKAQTS